MFNCGHIPRLDGGHTHALRRRDSFYGSLHNCGIKAITRKGGNACFLAGTHQNIVVGHIVVLIAVVHGHRTHGACKKRIGKPAAKNFQPGIRGEIFVQRIHVHTDILPCLIVAFCAVTGSLCTGAGHGAAAGAAIAHGARLALAAVAAGSFHYFLKSHTFFLFPVLRFFLYPIKKHPKQNAGDCLRFNASDAMQIILFFEQSVKHGE